MARLRRPDLPLGPIGDLVHELHQLHARAGLPSTRALAKGQRFTYTTVHDIFTKTSVEPPRLPVLLCIVEQMATLAQTVDVQETLDKFDRLWMAADEQAATGKALDEESPARYAVGLSSSANSPAWSLDRVNLPGEDITPGLRKAIGNGNLYLEYQPIYDRAGVIGAVEAFVRCRQADGTTIRADVLIPKIAEAGLLPELDFWVLHAAAMEAAGWPAVRGRVPRLAVNMSAQSDAFEDAIVEVVLSTGLALSRLSIEVEDQSIRRFSAARLLKLCHLTSHRMGLAIDDVGRGYETLAGLGDFPIEAIKIDDSIVQHVAPSSAELKVAQRVSGSAARMGISTIATGIESKEQLELLQEMGVTGYQGHFFGRPVSASGLNDLLDNG